jgi:DNA-binding helix-hairpin-helix protein with protein kinase domain
VGVVRIGHKAPLQERSALMPSGPQADLVATMKALQAALGDNDLAKQVFADANAADRQTRQNHSDARKEYVRQMAERSEATENSIREYGLQTLKWAVLAQRRRDCASASLCGWKGR